MKVKIAYQDGSSFATVSPFDIAAALRQLVGDVDAAKPTSTGVLCIQTRNGEQVKTLLQQDRFLDKPAKFSTIEQLTFVEAYKHAPALLNVSAKRITAELASQGVIEARRLRPKNGEKNPRLRLSPHSRTLHPGEVGGRLRYDCPKEVATFTAAMQKMRQDRTRGGGLPSIGGTLPPVHLGPLH